jgi:DNA invertase Pin-like site-specific DNA recombinase
MIEGHDIGYVRVSSTGQNTERQLDKIKLHKTFTEKASAGSRKRPVLDECLEYLREGDTLHVHSIDRLARNLKDLLDIVTQLKNKNVSVQFHKEKLTFGAGDDPMSKLMLQIFGAVAEFERTLIRERQAEGIAKAKKKGTRFGQKPKLTPAQVKEVRQMVADRYTKRVIAEKFGVSIPTIYNALKSTQNR